MDKLSNLALIAQMIDAAEKNIQSAKQLLREGGAMSATRSSSSSAVFEKASAMASSDGDKVIEGVFDGQNMIGPEGKQYPVPANYASKSKLVEGDILKLTIADDSRSFCSMRFMRLSDARPIACDIGVKRKSALS